MDLWRIEKLLADLPEIQPDPFAPFPVHRLNDEEREQVYRLTGMKMSETELETTYDSAVRLGVIPRSTREETEEFLDTVHPPTEDYNHKLSTISNGLGKLKAPVEILDMILSDRCIEAVIWFRNSSKAGKMYVEANGYYKMVIEHAPALFKALIKIGLASDERFTLRAVATVLKKSSCQGCETQGKHGFLLFLPTLTRCCLTCLPLLPKFAVYTNTNKSLPEVREEDRQERLEILRSQFPDNFSPEQVLQFKPLPATPGVPLIFRAHHASLPPVLEVSGPQHPAIYGNLIHFTTQLILFLYGNKQPKAPWSDGQYWYRYLACTIIPHLDNEYDDQIAPTYPSDRRQELKVQIPLRCKGCYQRPQIPPINGDYLRGTKTFSTDTFMDHFKRCQKAQKIWKRYQQSRLARERKNQVTQDNAQ
ncbi:hypothetical protein V8F20_003454 [Naviculisporaceae sp. PSN 640]